MALEALIPAGSILVSDVRELPKILMKLLRRRTKKAIDYFVCSSLLKLGCISDHILMDILVNVLTVGYCVILDLNGYF